MMITRQRLVWLLAGLLLTVPLLAQRKKAPKGPRAVAVLEWTAQGVRLIPVSLMIDGDYYDATLYRANPVPMAVDRDTVYQVQKAGDPVGDFTITNPAQLPNGAWIGQGFFESEEDRKKKAEEKAKASSAEATTKPENPQEDRPVLRRGKQTAEEPEGKPSEANKAPAPEPKQTAPVVPPTPVSAADEGRPVLRRGKPAEEQADKLGKDTLPHKTPPKPPAGIDKIQVAISDAGPMEARPYAWKWNNEGEEQKYRSDAEKLTLSLVNDYAKRTGGPQAGKIEVSGWHAFDLAYNNEPTVILTAKVLPAAPNVGAVKKAHSKAAAPAAPPAPVGFVFYITLVAQEDIYGQLQKIYAVVTDNKHLDAFPRYELIDAVDADGDHNGELLFRRISDISSSFVLFRLYGNSLNELLRVPEPRAISAGE